MSESRGWTRREALGILGMGVAAAALPEFASAAPLTFLKGAVIRTILKDYAPEELAGGATLFHEHMSFADNFMTRWGAYSAETRAIRFSKEGRRLPGAALQPVMLTAPRRSRIHAPARIDESGHDQRQQ